MLTLALYQPDIPQNVGAAIRLAACTGAALDIIEPCGFPWDDRKIRKAAMDYMTLVKYNRHISWQSFLEDRGKQRIILVTTRAQTPYTRGAFRPDDVILMGRESAGVPDEVFEAADERVRIPMQPGARSLNVINAAAMVLGEALRQTGTGDEDLVK